MKTNIERSLNASAYSGSINQIRRSEPARENQGISNLIQFLRRTRVALSSPSTSAVQSRKFRPSLPPTYLSPAGNESRSGKFHQGEDSQDTFGHTTFAKFVFKRMMKNSNLKYTLTTLMFLRFYLSKQFINTCNIILQL